MPIKIELPIEEIVQLYREGSNLKEIAHLYGVSSQTIARNLEPLNIVRTIKVQIIKCEICSVEVETTSSIRKYCDECGKARQQESMKKWQEKNIQHLKDYNKEYVQLDSTKERRATWARDDRSKKSPTPPPDHPGTCDICGCTPTKLKADHDHTCHSGKQFPCEKCLRGFLCHRCNLGLGMFEDDEDRLMDAVDYLRKFRKNTDAGPNS